MSDAFLHVLRIFRRWILRITAVPTIDAIENVALATNLFSRLLERWSGWYLHKTFSSIRVYILQLFWHVTRKYTGTEPRVFN